jgi:hypothetical protein
VVLDEFTRECLTIEVRRASRSEDVVQTLDNLTAQRGAPLRPRAEAQDTDRYDRQALVTGGPTRATPSRE